MSIISFLILRHTRKLKRPRRHPNIHKVMKGEKRAGSYELKFALPALRFSFRGLMAAALGVYVSNRRN